jgi:hypothetical protein
MIDEKYYEYYLSKHEKRGNRGIHLLGNLMTLVYIGVIIAGFNLWLLLLSPLVVYPFAIFGHWVCDDKEPAFLTSNPLKAKLADIRMSWETLTGKI